MNKKKALAVTYIICAIVAFLLFFKYSHDKYVEEYAIRAAEWEARTGSSAAWYEYFWAESVYRRNVLYFGLALVLVSAFLAIVADWITSPKPTRK